MSVLKQFWRYAEPSIYANLGAASDLVGDIATVLIDTGMEARAKLSPSLGDDQLVERPSRNATGNARQDLSSTPDASLSQRVRALLERRWEAAKMPSEGWVCATATASGNIEPSTLKKQHQRALKHSGVRPFVLYALRCTFLTRRGEAGCDAWTLARIAGHSSISIPPVTFTPARMPS